MKTSLDIVRNAKLKRIQIAVAQAYNYHDQLKRKLLLRQIRKEMKLASKIN